MQFFLTLLIVSVCIICYYTSVSNCVYTNIGPAPNPQPVSQSSITLLTNLANNMVSRWQALDDVCSPNAVFALLYIYMTKGGLDYVQAQYFEDGDAMTNLINVFAQRYLDGFDAYASGNLPSAPWQVAYNFSSTNKSMVLQDMMLGVNAHINYDLGIAVYTSNYGISASHKLDYDRVNDLMNNVTNPSLCDIGTRYDASMKPGYGSAGSNTLTLDLLVQWRNDAWVNAEKLYNGTTTYQAMSNYAVSQSTPYSTSSVIRTSLTRVPYCQQNHNTNPTCPTSIFRR